MNTGHVFSCFLIDKIQSNLSKHIDSVAWQ